MLRPDTKPKPGMRAFSAGSRVNAPSRCSAAPNSSRVRGPSPASRSNTKRSKLDALEMSIDGLDVSCVSVLARTRYDPVRKNSSSTSFSLVATTSWEIGRPIMRATCPAQTLPKLPDGTAKLTVSPLAVVAWK